MNKKILLWLDDFRDPFNKVNTLPNIEMVIFCYEYLTKQDDIVWVKNFNEFTNWITENGLPHKISFDHDLADEHYAPQEMYDNYNLWASQREFKEKTGLDCANWLIDYCIDNNLELPIFTVHSANKSGAENIKRKLTNFLKFKNKET